MATMAARINLNDHVYETLRERILGRRPGAGAKLSLHELATELGVSRSPVHHALTRLVQEGLLTVKARRGYYVTPITAKAIDDGYDVRLALELFAAERTVGRIGSTEMSGFLDVLERSIDAISRDGWDVANARFHEYQVDLAGNELLSRHYRELSVNLMMQVVRRGQVEGGSYLVSEHAAIVEASVRGDLDAAREAIRTHVESGRRIALDALERAGGEL
jgi:GntR family transcriptional regulator, rspAB operon transcriptional repressor